MEATDLETLLTDKGTRAIKPVLDLLLMEEETADVAVPEGKNGPVSAEDDWPHPEAKLPLSPRNKRDGAPTQGWKAIILKFLQGNTGPWVILLILI